MNFAFDFSALAVQSVDKNYLTAFVIDIEMLICNVSAESHDQLLISWTYLDSVPFLQSSLSSPGRQKHLYPTGVLTQVFPSPQGFQAQKSSLCSAKQDVERISCLESD